MTQGLRSLPTTGIRRHGKEQLLHWGSELTAGFRRRQYVVCRPGTRLPGFVSRFCPPASCVMLGGVTWPLCALVASSVKERESQQYQVFLRSLYGSDELTSEKLPQQCLAHVELSGGIKELFTKIQTQWHGGIFPLASWKPVSIKFPFSHFAELSLVY